MSSFRYCDEIKPHDAHEWYETVLVTSYTTSWAYYHCCGVKESPELTAALLLLEKAERKVAARHTFARILAKMNRRSIDEFYHGDGCAPHCSGCGAEWCEDHDPKYRAPS